MRAQTKEFAAHISRHSRQGRPWQFWCHSPAMAYAEDKGSPARGGQQWMGKARGAPGSPAGGSPRGQRSSYICARLYKARPALTPSRPMRTARSRAQAPV